MLFFGHSLRGSVDVQSIVAKNANENQKVTPCVGVWMSKHSTPLHPPPLSVTPCVGVWMSNVFMIGNPMFCGSLPAWECGCPSLHPGYLVSVSYVTPCVGVWMSILFLVEPQPVRISHSLRGSVDVHLMSI